MTRLCTKVRFQNRAWNQSPFSLRGRRAGDEGVSLPTPSTAKRHRLYPPLLARARELRHPLTPAEQLIWQNVRNSRLGHKIRRQHIIGHFIADFYCASAKLVIEIDGDVHAEPDQAAYDIARTEWLELYGYRVIRFDNRDIQQNLNNVLLSIKTAIDERLRQDEE